MNKFLNQRGMSLIQVMLAGAMMVGIAVVGMRIQENQNKAVKGAEQNSEATSLVSLISNIVTGRRACTNTFATMAASVPNRDEELEYNQPIKNSDGDDLFIVGNSYGLLRYEGMTVFNDNNSGFDYTTTGTEVQSGLLLVTLKFSRIDSQAAQTNKGALGGRQIGRKLMIYVNLNSDGTFRDCYDLTEGVIETVVSNICADLGGDYDPDTRICDPQSIFQNPSNLRLICEGLEFTWDSVNERCDKYIRGAHYGGCSKELLADSQFKGTYNQVWPILDCSNNPPTCDVGFKAVQLAGGLVNVTPFGELRAEMSTIWETWACAKE